MVSTPEAISLLPSSIRRDTVSTTSSDKLPSLPSGRWPLTIHGNCARCGHHHKAAVIQISVVEGICEASHVICERCGQKWLTIGAPNSTQISLLSTITTDLDNGEINFRHTLFSIVRSAASIASPTALFNVPEDPTPTPSRSSSGRGRAVPHNSVVSGNRNTSAHNTHSEITSGIETNPVYVQDGTTVGQRPSTNQFRPTRPTIASIKRKFKNTIGILRKVQLKGFIRRPKDRKINVNDDRDHTLAEQLESEPPLALFETVASEFNESDNPSRDTEHDHGNTVNTAIQAIEDLKRFDKEVIRSMTPQQRKDWIREQITAFKCRCTPKCVCKRRHSASSMLEQRSIREYRISPATSSFQRVALDQMGSQFDAFPGTLFTHTGPLTISATRISEADTAVENQPTSPSPRLSRLEPTQQTHRSRSPLNSRHSWQPSRSARVQRNSMDSILAGSTVRNP